MNCVSPVVLDENQGSIEIPFEVKNFISFRKLYLGQLREQTITRMFRPGNRLNDRVNGYVLGQNAIINVLDVPGSKYHGIEPVVLDEHFPVKLIKIQVKKLEDLVEGDFLNAGFDTQTKDQLRLSLANIYNLGVDEVYNSDFEVTITDFKYLPKDKVKIIR